jgi:hypothetical protein
MSTKKAQIKKLEPNSKKSQTLQAAYMVSHEIVMSILAQHLIPCNVEPLGLEGQTALNQSTNNRITHEDTSRMLSIALDHLDVAHQRITAYESAIEKIKSRMDVLHNVIEKPEVAGRVTNALLKKDAEDVAVEYFETNGKFIQAEQLSKKVSKKVFDRDPEEYIKQWKKMFHKNNPSAQLPSGFENSTSWTRYSDDYRVLPTRTAHSWLKKIYGELGLKK